MSSLLKLPILLVVSESPKMRIWVKKHLDERFFILSADTKTEALNAFSSKVDSVLLDASMQREDPLALCVEIRKKDSLVPIILMTGKLKKTFREKAHQAGATDFLSDQFDIQELQNCLENGKKSASIKEKTKGLSQTFQKNLLPQNAPSLKNKIVFSDAALKTLQEAKKQNLPVSSLFIRIDAFDLWENKEEVSLSLQTFIQNFLREKDVLLPLPEGKFILILFNTFSEAAQKAAIKLKQKIDAHPFSAMRKLTVSIGFFETETNKEAFEKLANLALKSLHTKPETNLIFSIMSKFNEPS